MNLRIFLLPFSFLYNLITRIRNLLFEYNILKSVSPKVLSIGIGNLRVGGTGKTPISAYLLSILAQNSSAYISRGYGRKTKGVYSKKSISNVSDLGDEAFMIAKLFPDLNIILSGNRKLALEHEILKSEKIKTIIFDDVFQHRYVTPTVNILLSTFSDPFYEDHVLPYGNLREHKSNAERADILIVTKVPKNASYQEKESYEALAAEYLKENTPVFFAEFNQQEAVNLLNETIEKKTKVILISGLADNEVFRNDTSKTYFIQKHFSFSDHHDFSIYDINRIKKESFSYPWVCSLKDYFKILSLLPENEHSKLFYIHQKVKLLEEEKFISTLNSFGIKVSI